MSHLTFINALVKREKLTSGAELGVRDGVFSEYLLKQNPDLFMYCVDAWEQLPGMQEYEAGYNHTDHYTEAVKCLNPYLDTSADIIVGSIVFGAWTIKDDSLDFIFHDASHDYKSIKADIQVWYPKVKDNGWITGHDYNPSRGVMRFVDEMCAHFKLGGTVNTTWICKKTDIDYDKLYS
jgi:hypothetical protein